MQCERLFGATRGAEIQALVEESCGGPCPCKQGAPCPLTPGTQERPRLRLA